MIFWSGYGFLVAVVFFVNSLILNILINYLMNDEYYYDSNLIPPGISFLMSGLFIKLLANYFSKKNLENKGTRVFDITTISNGDANKFFFIPFRYWSVIMAGLGLSLIVAELLKKFY